MNTFKVLLSAIFTVAVCAAQDESENITVQDIDGNVYQAIKIGDQVWTVENLRTTRFNDGTNIYKVSDQFNWDKGDDRPVFCFSKYTSDTESILKYGAYYNLYAASSEKLAPKGWHVATSVDWQTLAFYLLSNGYSWDGTTEPSSYYTRTGISKIAKTMAAEKYWDTSSVTGSIGDKKIKSRKCGFSALPGGYVDFDGKFINVNYSGSWWGVPNAHYGLYVDKDKLYCDELQNKADSSYGYTVRLVKDYTNCDIPDSNTAQKASDKISVTDLEGNVYHAIKIGDQIWTVENLRSTKLNDGTSIKNVPKDNSWHRLKSPGYCWYNNTANADSIRQFGALYNWYAVDTKALAPKGWHVPTKADWKALEKYLIENGYNWDKTTKDNKIAFSMADTKYWHLSDCIGSIGFMGSALKKDGKCGFSALPGGYREGVATKSRNREDFRFIGYKSHFWSATEKSPNENCSSYGTDYSKYAYSVSLSYDRVDFENEDCYGRLKSSGFSVRLVKDNTK